MPSYDKVLKVVRLALAGPVLLSLGMHRERNRRGPCGDQRPENLDGPSPLARHVDALPLTPEELPPPGSTPRRRGEP
jgi:hypothetical protein